MDKITYFDVEYANSKNKSIWWSKGSLFCKKSSLHMASLILALTLGAIGVCISYIARNTALLHRRELEILNQIGASDGFVARQMQIIVGRICVMAAGAGFLAATPVLLLIISSARSARIGLMAMMGLSWTGWITLTLLPVAIIAFAIWITRRTTFNILKAN